MEGVKHSSPAAEIFMAARQHVPIWSAPRKRSRNHWSRDEIMWVCLQISLSDWITDMCIFIVDILMYSPQVSSSHLWFVWRQAWLKHLVCFLFLSVPDCLSMTLWHIYEEKGVCVYLMLLQKWSVKCFNFILFFSIHCLVRFILSYSIIKMHRRNEMICAMCTLDDIKSVFMLFFCFMHDDHRHETRLTGRWQHFKGDLCCFSTFFEL